jgi:hypothetical protein
MGMRYTECLGRVIGFPAWRALGSSTSAIDETEQEIQGRLAADTPHSAVLQTRGAQHIGGGG